MKFFKFSIVSLFITIFLTSCGPTEKEIDRYNNAIVIQQNAVINAETKLINAIMDNDTVTIPITLNDFIYQIETSLTAVQEIEEIDPDISLKKAAISMFNAYLSIAINEYPEIIELKKLSDQEFTEDKEKRFNQLSSKINQILDKKNMEFSETQKKLSEKHKIVFKTFLNGQ